jgi:putative membrane protein
MKYKMTVSLAAVSAFFSLAVVPPVGAASLTADTLWKIHQTNQLEIEVGKLAEKRGQVRAVRDYGRTLVADHRRLDDDTLGLARAQDIHLDNPKLISDKTKSDIDDTRAKIGELTSTSRITFDREFAKAMLNGHGQCVADLEAVAAKTDNDGLKMLIHNALPVLKKHERIALRIEKQVLAE